jgi:putative oxidoreductase
MDKRKLLFDPGPSAVAAGLGLLVLRVGFGGIMAIAHGYGKLPLLLEGGGSFPDPLGIGSLASIALATAAELGGSILLVLGFMGRLAAIPLVVTMSVAFFLHHASDPFGGKEKALLYLVAFVVLLITGPGRYSVDGLIRGK